MVGYGVAIGYGAFDFSSVSNASWIGLPDATWPGLDPTFDHELRDFLFTDKPITHAHDHD